MCLSTVVQGRNSERSHWEKKNKTNNKKSGNVIQRCKAAKVWMSRNENATAFNFASYLQCHFVLDKKKKNVQRAGMNGHESMMVGLST